MGDGLVFHSQSKLDGLLNTFLRFDCEFVEIHFLVFFNSSKATPTPFVGQFGRYLFLFHAFLSGLNCDAANLPEVRSFRNPFPAAMLHSEYHERTQFVAVVGSHSIYQHT
jgi:hypothetical protein